MTILATGSSGLIGSEAVDHFASQGHDLFGIDNSMRADVCSPGGDTLWTLRRIRETHPRITGGAGCVGSNLAVRLTQAQFQLKVYALDNLRRRGSEPTLPRLRQHESHLFMATFEVLIMPYHGYSWYNLLCKLSGTHFEHHAKDAPIVKLYSTREMRTMLNRFSQVELEISRLPEVTAKRHGLLALLYNKVFVPACQLLPERMIKPFGFHFVARATK